MRVAVVGAGWSGCAAALTLARQGHAATVFEASRIVGGRARAVSGPNDEALDNGQHILIGAYTETLRLMQSVGVNLQKSLHAMPLTMQFPDGAGLRLPKLPPPLDAAVGIALAKGWSLRDKFSLLRAATRWRLQGFVCSAQATVAQLCEGVSARVMVELLEPLCVSALNTPAAQASGQVFLRVLKDSLFAPTTALGPGSTLLLPRTDLSALFPRPALQEVQRLGADVRLGSRVQKLEAAMPLDGQTTGPGDPLAAPPQWLVDGEPFDAVVLACPATEAARLVAACDANPQWVQQANALRYEAITTVYAHAPGVRLAQPMLALRSSPQAPAQFVFDRGPLGGPAGLLAFVVSASNGEREWLEQRVLEQGKSALGLADLQPIQTIVEKRATFACTPGLTRPPIRIAQGLLACGDYVDGPYPATLEGAVRSGLACAGKIGSGIENL